MIAGITLSPAAVAVPDPGRAWVRRIAVTETVTRRLPVRVALLIRDGHRWRPVPPGWISVTPARVTLRRGQAETITVHGAPEPGTGGTLVEVAVLPDTGERRGGVSVLAGPAATIAVGSGGPARVSLALQVPIVAWGGTPVQVRAVETDAGPGWIPASVTWRAPDGTTRRVPGPDPLLPGESWTTTATVPLPVWGPARISAAGPDGARANAIMWAVPPAGVAAVGAAAGVEGINLAAGWIRRRVEGGG